jgi:hypothetical protein
MIQALEPIFVGTHDMTHSKVASLRRPEYRERYERAYNDDLKQHGELTLDRANRVLSGQIATRELVLRLWDEVCSGRSRTELSATEASLMRVAEKLPRKPLSKEELLKLNRYLLQPADVDVNTVIQDPFELGNIAEILYAEKLPRLRLWTHFKEYVVGGTPDGVADSYIYEFKSTTQTGEEIERIKKMATRQALIYAYIFRRPNIKVQVAEFRLDKNHFPFRVKDLPRPRISTMNRPASEAKALAILEDFDAHFRNTPLSIAA